MKLLGRKGITLVETIIAMTLLVIITSSALTISLSSTKITSNSYLRFNAVNMTNDIIEIFQDSEDEQEFIDFINLIYNVDIKRNINGSIYFTYENVLYNVFPSGRIILIECTSKDKEHTYYEYNYVKGEK